MRLSGHPINPPTLYTTKTSDRPTANRQNVARFAGSPNDQVTFKGEAKPPEINSIADFYRVLDSFESPRNEDGLQRELTLERLFADEKKVEALLRFLGTEEGKKICVTVTPFNEQYGFNYKKISFDGKPQFILLTYGSQNVDPEKPETFPNIQIHDSSKDKAYPVYNTTAQISNCIRATGSGRSIIPSALGNAAKLEELVYLHLQD